MEANEKDKSPDIQKTKKQLSTINWNGNLELKPEYLDRKKVQSRLFGELQSNKEKKVDWKNLEKLTMDAIGKSDLPLSRLQSLSNVLTNELVRLQKLDEKLTKETSKSKKLKINIFRTQKEGFERKR